MNKRTFGKLVKKETLGTTAYNFILENINNGNIQGDELLSEVAIANELNMSRTPVREAIRRLESEGLLVSMDGIGTIVNSFSEKELKDMYEVRIALEQIASETSIHRISKDKVDAVKYAFNEIEKMDEETMESEEIIERLYVLDNELHRLLIENSENSYVKYMIHTINNSINRYRHTAYSRMNTAKTSLEHHLKIIECIENVDVECIKITLKEHIEWSLFVLLNSERK